MAHALDFSLVLVMSLRSHVFIISRYSYPIMHASDAYKKPSPSQWEQEHILTMSSDYTATAQAIRENQARRNSNSSMPMFSKTANPTSPDMATDRRQSWDWAETHAPSYNTTSTAAKQSAPLASASAMTQQAPPTAAPAPTAPMAPTQQQQRRPSWVARHLSMGDEDARRAFGL